MIRTRLPLMACAVAALTLLGSGLAAAAPERTPDADAPNAQFYTPPFPLVGKAGDVIRTEPLRAVLDPIVHVPIDARATRIMYRSTDTHGAPTAMAATVLEPTAPWTGKGKRPLVAVAPGTQGGADRCAPSHELEYGSFYDVAASLELLVRGWTVALIDYAGSGTPGAHTYLNRAEAGYAMLDAARAASGLVEHGPIGISGYSQGGQAAAAAAELQPTYAPDLPLAAAYAGGVPADLTAEIATGSLFQGEMGYLLNMMIASYPDKADAIRKILNPTGLAFLADTRRECDIETAAHYGLVPSNLYTNDGRPIRDHFTEEPFKSILDAQRVGRLRPGVPTLVIQGSSDDSIPAEQARQLVRDWRGLGADVKYAEILEPPFLPGTALTHAIPLVPATEMGAIFLGEHF